MSIRFDPKVGGALPTSGTTDTGATEPGRAPARRDLEAMDKPKGLGTPDSARNRPDPGRAANREPELKQMVAQLRAALQGDPAQRLAAAHAAMAQCAAYSLRRSRGARQNAIDLCDQITEDVPELAGAARLLKGTLAAETLLQDNSAESTLRAVQSLMQMLQQLEAPEST